MPPEELSLFGSTWWEEASDQERRAYAKREAANCAAWIVELEYALLTILVRVGRSARSTDKAAAMALEASDELRHIRMFQRVIESTGEDGDLLGPGVRFSTWLFRRRLVGDTLPFLATYLLESYILCVHQSCLESDAELHPIARQAHLRHTSDEVRHLALAQDEIVERWADLGAAGRLLARLLLPTMAASVIRTAFVLPPAAPGLINRRQTRRLESHRQRQQRRFQPSFDFLQSAGVVGRTSASLWRVLGVVAA